MSTISQCEVSTVSTVSESPSRIQLAILQNELKTIRAKLQLVNALIFERRAGVEYVPNLEAAVRECVALSVVANLTELGMETAIGSTGSLEVMYRVLFPVGHEDGIREESVPTARNIMELLNEMVAPNHKKSSLGEKINESMSHVCSTLAELQKATANYKDNLKRQTVELKAKKEAMNEESLRLEKKIKLKLVKVDLMKSLICALLGTANVDFIKNPQYADGIRELRKPINSL